VSDIARRTGAAGSETRCIFSQRVCLTGDDSVKDHINQRSFSDDYYEEYIESTPLEARFDYTTIELAVIEGFPKHEAYGMMFETYQRKRAQFSEYDPSEKKQMSFYFQGFPARVALDLALINKLPAYYFLVTMIELGLIHFQVDYHDEYIIVKEGRQKVFALLRSDTAKKNYNQIERQTISLGAAAGYRSGKAKHFSPSVPKWLYNAIMDTSNYLNMPVSDFCYLCWCISASNCFPNEMIPEMVDREICNVVQEFEFELKHYSTRIEDILKLMQNDLFE